MIEPLLRLREVHFMRGDSFQNFGAWTPNTVRIRKILEQTAAQRSQDALFLSLGICLCVQVCLTFLIQGFMRSVNPWMRKVWQRRQCDYSWKAIAAWLGITEQQAKMKFYYGLQKIRQSIMQSVKDPKSYKATEVKGRQT